MGTAQKQARAYSAAHFVLVLDGNNSVGVIRSIDGGGVKSEIVTYQMGDNHDQWRQLGKPTYEDLKIEFGMSMSKSFYTWIQSFFEGTVVRKNGAVLAGDFHYAERARREFQDALIKEITFPKLDGSDSNPCYMTATISPEILRYAKGSGSALDTTLGKMTQKLWTSSNFRFTLDDSLKDACRRVSKIDSFTIKQEIHDYHAGNLHTPLRVPGMLEFPNLVVYVPEADVDPFVAHYNKYALSRELQRSPRLTGAIDVLDHTGEELCTVGLKGVDIASLTPDKSDATSEDIKQVKLELTIEEMSFTYKSDAVG